LRIVILFLACLGQPKPQEQGVVPGDYFFLALHATGNNPRCNTELLGELPKVVV